MTKPVSISIEDYDYNLSEERIAKYPLKKRDHSKLLIYQDNKIEHRKFFELAGILEAGDELFFNTTRVIQARLQFTKPTGAKIEIFCLEPIEPAEYQQSFSSTKPIVWKCLLGNAKKWKEGILSANIEVNGEIIQFNAEKGAEIDGKYLINFSWDRKHYTFADLLENAGTTPIPPYLKRDAERSDAKTYQTVYARFNGSVAAPTAGLHFTDEVLEKLSVKGIESHHLTLHVGAGTFIPVKEENAVLHTMHAELVTADMSLLTSLLNNKKRRIAVGTTTVRSLESIYWLGVRSIIEPLFSFENLILEQWSAYEMNQNISLKESIESLINAMDNAGIDSFSFHTQIMITPGYSFRIIDGLITNFHQPKSTLLLLIAAIVGDDWKEIYHYAMENNFRFLSYGDSSLFIM